LLASIQFHGLVEGAFQMNWQVLFCTAACKADNGSFTIAPHPDVGEGASPQPVLPEAGFLFARAFTCAGFQARVFRQRAEWRGASAQAPDALARA